MFAVRNTDNEKFIEVRKSARSRLSIHFVLSRDFIPHTFFGGTYGNVGAPPRTGFRISIWRASVKERVIGVPTYRGEPRRSTVVCRRMAAFPRTLFFGNRLLAGRARDFLECFRCLVHVWALASVRSDTKGELTAFSRSYARFRILMKSRFNRSHFPAILFSQKKKLLK